MTMHYSTKSNQETGATVYSPSDGSELIPAEVKLDINGQNYQSLNIPLLEGYTVDDEGIINNYGSEPKIYLSKYPSSEQQKWYILQGLGAVLLVALVLLITFSVS
jgi:hypothetical protein